MRISGSSNKIESYLKLFPVSVREIALFSYKDEFWIHAYVVINFIILLAREGWRLGTPGDGLPQISSENWRRQIVHILQNLQKCTT